MLLVVNVFVFMVIFYLNNNFIKVIYTEIEKAFDSVSVSRLIKTLIQYKIHNNLFIWFRELLSGRTQRLLIKMCRIAY